MTDLDHLVQDLAAAAERAQDGVRLIANKAGVNMKNDWAQRWTGMRGMQHLAHAVNYDLRTGPSWAEVEVGPDKSREQGPLGNIAEFGTSTQPPKRPAGAAVLKTEADNVQRLIDDISRRL